MRSLRSLGAICAVCLAFSSHAAADGLITSVLSALSGPNQTGPNTAIGPDGTYYALVPGSNSTLSMPSSELIAVGVTATPATKWTATLTGEIGAILPGANTVFVVQTVITGSGRTATSTTSILSYSAATGAVGTTITPPSGTISDITVKTIGGTDYLYVHTTSVSTSQSGGSTTITTTRTLTIYSQTGTVIKTVTL
jgi:hypothetical protein